MLLYFVCFLDRSNISYAALRMNADIGLSNTAFGFGAGIFFIGYVLFQIPSNIALTRYGPRRWIGTIAVIWGAIAALMATIHGATEFYVLRFVLGAVEAGLFPGILFYLTLWFPLQQRGRVTAMLVVAGSTSPLIGAPLSTWLMEFVDGRIGLHGWQLMFIIESVPAILLGFWCLYRMPNGPADVRWLAGEETAWLQATLDAERARIRRASGGTQSVRSAFSPLVIGLGFIFLGFVFGEYAIGFFLPLIIESLNVRYQAGLSIAQVGLLGAVPYLVAAVVIIAWGYRSDRKNERIAHTIIPSLVGAAAIVYAVYADSLPLAIVAFSLTTAGVLSAQSVFWQIPSQCLTGVAAAAGLALINAMGNFAGFLGPMIMGAFKDIQGSYNLGLWTLAGFLVLSALGTSIVGSVLRTELRLPPE